MFSNSSYLSIFTILVLAPLWDVMYVGSSLKRYPTICAYGLYPFSQSALYTSLITIRHSCLLISSFTSSVEITCVCSFKWTPPNLYPFWVFNIKFWFATTRIVTASRTQFVFQPVRNFLSVFFRCSKWVTIRHMTTCAHVVWLIAVEFCASWFSYFNLPHCSSHPRVQKVSLHNSQKCS